MTKINFGEGLRMNYIRYYNEFSQTLNHEHHAWRICARGQGPAQGRHQRNHPRLWFGGQGAPLQVRRLAVLICAAGLWAGAALAGSPESVTVTIDTHASGPVIPDDFMGLSFGMKALPGNKAGAHLFSDTNTPLVTLFQNVGLRHLRVGGTTVESPPKTPIPNQTDIDNLFAFARAAGVKKIIYSLRLLETNAACNYAATNAAIAKYIWDHYQSQLDHFAIGNEPELQRVFKQDYVIRGFPTYNEQWKKFAAAITEAVPEATFVGPDAGSGNAGWSAKFGNAVQDMSSIKQIAMHYYAGGKGKGVAAAEGIDTMLSPGWLKNYQALHGKIVPIGLPYLFTEANDHYSGGISNASDTFAGALWALDFLHWWAAHDAQRVDFHNTQWVVSDIVTPTAEGRFKINPKGYGLKTFDLGAHGQVEGVTVSNSQSINLTAYAVRNAQQLFVTLINKEHGPNARSASVIFEASSVIEPVEAIFLNAPNGDVAARTGVTLGGATIDDDAPWRGKWTPLANLSLNLPAASAAVVKFSTQ